MNRGGGVPPEGEKKSTKRRAPAVQKGERAISDAVFMSIRVISRGGVAKAGSDGKIREGGSAGGTRKPWNANCARVWGRFSGKTRKRGTGLRHGVS